MDNEKEMLTGGGLSVQCGLTEAADRTLVDMFQYHPWDENQQASGLIVRAALLEAARAIVQHVPPCADRSVALRKIREARMDANSAITHKGRY